MQEMPAVAGESVQETRCSYTTHTHSSRDTVMTKISDMYPSRWLKASDCEDEDLAVTIDRIVEEEIGQARDLKWVVYFKELDKGLVLNKTNTTTIAKLWGDDTDDWEGCQITLYATEVQFQGDMVEAIRVRSKPPKGKKPSRPSPAVMPVNEKEHDSDEIPF